MANNNLPAYLNNPTISERLVELVGDKEAAKVKSAVLNIWNNNELLQKCDPRSIMGAVGLAAALNLSITPTLGQAYVVPYHGKAQFMVGKRGLIQLAHRTKQYTALHAGAVHEGEFKGFDPFTGRPERGERTSDTVVGYVAYMQLVNGFEKWVYMTVAELEAHAEKYSQSYAYDKRNGKSSSPWSTNFDAMAQKTVLKRLLNNWGVLSADMAEAIQGDQAVVDKSTFTYVDNRGDVQRRDDLYVEDVPFVETTGEVVAEPLNVEAQA